MASGDTVINANGNEVVLASGNVQVDSGGGDPCCCEDESCPCGQWSSACGGTLPPDTISVMLDGWSGCAYPCGTDPGQAFGWDTTGFAINGIYTLTRQACQPGEPGTPRCCWAFSVVGPSITRCSDGEVLLTYLTIRLTFTGGGDWRLSIGMVQAVSQPTVNDMCGSGVFGAGYDAIRDGLLCPYDIAWPAYASACPAYLAGGTVDVGP